MKKLVEGEIDRITIVKENMITRDTKTKEVVNKYQEKDLRWFMIKERLLGVINVLRLFPGGFSKILLLLLSLLLLLLLLLLLYYIT